MTSTESCRNCGSAIEAAVVACLVCGAPRVEGPSNQSMWESIGDQLARAAAPRYVVASLLGHGGMAGVYLAEEPRLGRHVAIKVMPPALMMDASLIARFEQEARTTARLTHPNIVTVFDFDQRDGLHYFVMEYVPGATLAQIMPVAAREPLPTLVVLHVLAQVASALGYAHRMGVVHRDVKPGNVILDSDGNARVMDFGIARIGDTPGLTRTGFLIGSPAYMSPEQCCGAEVTPASDQYSLGVVAYELLTGRPPFVDNTLAVLNAHMNRPPPPIGELRPDIPAEVHAGIERMLAKRPEDRFPSMAATVLGLGAAILPEDDDLRRSLAGSAAEARQGPRPARAIRPAAPASVRGGGSLTLMPPRGALTAGERIALAPSLGGSVALTGEQIAWSTSDPAIATIAPDGSLDAHGPGMVTITATAGAFSASAVFSVVGDGDPGDGLNVRGSAPGRGSRVDDGSGAAPSRNAGPGVALMTRRRTWVAAGGAAVLIAAATLAVRGGNETAGESTPGGAVAAAAGGSPTDAILSGAAGTTEAPSPADSDLVEPQIEPAALSEVAATGESPRSSGPAPGPARPIDDPIATAGPLPPTAAATAPPGIERRVEDVAPPPPAATLATDPGATPSPAATPPAVESAAAVAEVHAEIARFVGALERRDVDQIVASFPGAGGTWARDWRQFYEDTRGVRDLRASLDGVLGPEITGATARASFAVLAEFSDTRGRQRPRFEFEATFERGASGWILSELRQTR